MQECYLGGNDSRNPQALVRDYMNARGIRRAGHFEKPLLVPKQYPILWNRIFLTMFPLESLGGWIT